MERGSFLCKSEFKFQSEYLDIIYSISEANNRNLFEFISNYPAILGILKNKRKNLNILLPVYNQ